MPMEIKVLGWDMQKNVAGLNRWIYVPTLSIDNYISNVKTDINKQTNKNPVHIQFNSMDLVRIDRS